MIENVEAVIFIHSGSQSVEKRIMEALITIGKGMVYKGVNKSGPLSIKRKDIASPEKVRDILLELLR